MVSYSGISSCLIFLGFCYKTILEAENPVKSNQKSKKVQIKMGTLTPVMNEGTIALPNIYIYISRARKRNDI